MHTQYSTQVYIEIAKAGVCNWLLIRPTCARATNPSPGNTESFSFTSGFSAVRPWSNRCQCIISTVRLISGFSAALPLPAFAVKYGSGANVAYLC